MRKVHRLSWEQAAAALGLQDPFHPDGHGGSAMRNPMFLGAFDDLTKRMLENPEKFVGHFHLAPEKALQSLDPFEIRDDNASGVAKDIWNEKDFVPALFQNQVGFGSGRAVGAFSQNTALQLVGVLPVNHAINRSRHQH